MELHQDPRTLSSDTQTELLCGDVMCHRQGNPDVIQTKGRKEAGERGKTEGRVGRGEGSGGRPLEEQWGIAAHSGTLPKLGCPRLRSEQDAGTPCQELMWGRCSTRQLG